MLFWIIQRSTQSVDTGQFEAGQLLWFRVALSAVMAWLMVLSSGVTVVGWLKRRCGERIASDSARLNELQAAKQGTPTMGGLLIMGAVLASSLLWADLRNRGVLIGLAAGTGLMLIGAADDWVKLNSRRKGLTAKQKLAGQSVIAILAGMAFCASGTGAETGSIMRFLSGDVGWPTAGVLAIAWSAFVIVAGSNAVNLTDGLDGLAAGCTLSSGLSLTAILLICSDPALAAAFGVACDPTVGEFAIVSGALTGAMPGFLKFNRFPARVFMGDTGSLPIGGLLAVGALVSQHELLLIVIGGVFVIETLSVILQVGWYKMTGRRMIRCSPLHNHFLFGGAHETRIVKYFRISSAFLAVLGIVGLKVL